MRNLYGKRITAFVVAAVIGVASFQSAYASRKSDAQDAKAQAEEILYRAEKTGGQVIVSAVRYLYRKEAPYA